MENRPSIYTMFNSPKFNAAIRKRIGRVVPEITEIGRTEKTKDYMWGTCLECGSLLFTRMWSEKKLPALHNFLPEICNVCQTENKAMKQTSMIYKDFEKNEYHCITAPIKLLQEVTPLPQDWDKATWLVPYAKAMTILGKLTKMHYVKES